MSDKDNTTDDDDLWHYVTRDITPIDRQKPLVENAPKHQKRNAKNAATSKKTPQNTPPQTHYNAAQKTPLSHAHMPATDIDSRTNDRLRKGKIPIDARIDLHGMNQLDARTNLIRFLQIAHTRGQRCILVITGKGQKNRDPLAPATGILKTKTADWLQESPLNAIILKTHPAKPKDGGNGALYVLLRRQR